MSDQYLVENCSPTLAGLKTGNLFSVETGDDRQIMDEIRALNRILAGKGLRAIPVKQSEKHTLIYLYRPDYLDRDLCDPAVRNILESRGYNCDDAGCCISRMIKRVRNNREFPHEIGLFLGYPPADVRGFIKNPREGVKTIGYWKVYSDQEEAEKTFTRFRKCTETYRREIEKGRPLTDLIVRTDNRRQTGYRA